MTKLTALEPGVLKGITEPTINKIKKADIFTVVDLAIQMPKRLAEMADIGKDTAEKAIEKALIYVSSGYITATELHEQHKKRTKLSTGAKELDELLGGGPESETTLEVIGEKGTGKTQICMKLAIQAQLPIEEGGLSKDGEEAEVVWIDTEDTFRPDRIIEIAQACGLNAAEILSRIHHGGALTSQHQKVLVDKLTVLCNERNIKLIIVDSMMGHLRSEYLGRGMLAERQNLLGDILHKLGMICWIYKVTGVYTNQVMDNPAVLYGNPQKPIGGHIMGHAGTNRIHLRRGRGELRIASLKKSPYLPDGEARFKVTERGVEDVE